MMGGLNQSFVTTWLTIVAFTVTDTVRLSALASILGTLLLLTRAAAKEKALAAAL
jgi:hypothetical protein